MNFLVSTSILAARLPTCPQAICKIIEVSTTQTIQKSSKSLKNKLAHEKGRLDFIETNYPKDLRSQQDDF